MAQTVVFLITIALALSFPFINTFDTNPLQDICVADLTSTVRINGLPCKDPATVTADDFFLTGLDVPGNTTNRIGSAITPMNVARVPGLNTLGLTLARLDLAPNGFFPPHTHPRASEVLTVLEGSMEVGFVTTFPGYRHFRKVLKKGDAFAIPMGLLHYQRNVESGNTVVFSVVSSQNAGINAVADAIFGTKPEIDTDFLARAFQLDEEIVEKLQAKF